MNKIFRKFALFSLAAVCLPFVACNDDDDIDGGPEGGTAVELNHIDLFTPESVGNIEYKGDGIFLTDAMEEISLLPVRSTTPVSEDTKLTVKIAPIVLDIYNLFHDTEYRHIDNFEVVNPELTILKGQTQSTEPIKVRFTDFEEFQDARNDHMIALTVDSLPAGFSGGENSEMLVNFNKVFPPNPINVSSSLPPFGLVYQDGGFANLSSELKVRGLIKATNIAGKDITAKISIEPSLVEQYNATSDIQYEMFPNVSLKSDQVIINEGNGGGDVTFLFSDGMASVQKGTMYIIPVKLHEVSGEASLLGEDLVGYVRFDTDARPIFVNAAEPIGEKITEISDWIVSDNGRTNSWGKEWKEVLNNTTVDYLRPNHNLVIDMQTEQDVLTVQWTTDPDELEGYVLTDVTIGTSTDGVDYNDTHLVISGPTAVNNFVLPIARKARYIRIFSKNWVYPHNISVYGPEK